MGKKVIPVNKEVKITNEYIKASEGDFVLNISDMNETEGFTQFVVVMNGCRQCCEDVGYIKDDSIFGKTLYVKELGFNDVDDFSIKKVSGGTVCALDNGGAKEIIIRTVDEDYSLVFYNSHNGYYGHSIEMDYLKDGEVKFKYENWL